MSREIMQEAVIALDIAQSLLEQSRHHNQILGAYEALRQALAQPEQAFVPFPSFMRKRIEQAMEDAINPKGMSVHDGKATVLVSDLHRMLLIIDSAPYIGKGEESKIKHSLASMPEQEPVAWIGKEGKLLSFKNVSMPENIPVYAAPPCKPWVGLSDTEINKIVDLNTSDDGGFDIWCDGVAVARIICAKLKELNK